MSRILVLQDVFQPVVQDLNSVFPSYKLTAVKQSHRLQVEKQLPKICLERLLILFRKSENWPQKLWHRDCL